MLEALKTQAFMVKRGVLWESQSYVTWSEEYCSVMLSSYVVVTSNLDPPVSQDALFLPPWFLLHRLSMHPPEPYWSHPPQPRLGPCQYWGSCSGPLYNTAAPKPSGRWWPGCPMAICSPTPLPAAPCSSSSYKCRATAAGRGFSMREHGSSFPSPSTPYF